jgi:hypothetical protein
MNVINDGVGAMFTISETFELILRETLNEFSIEELKFIETKSMDAEILKYFKD